MSSTRTANTGHGVIDVEAGTVDAAGVKAAGVVAEKFYDAREQTRIDTDQADRQIDADPARNRAASDRDRAYPRDSSEIDDARKQRRLPERGEFRRALSSRQRKARSADKHRLVDTAPRTQVRSMARTIGDPQRWQEVNTSLREATGDAQQLDPRDRAEVQRMDRLIQGYERTSGRGHVVYAVVELPSDKPMVANADVPETLQPGARISFDQYTMCSHNLHEATHAVEQRRAAGNSGSSVIMEIETTRGMYLGRSDRIDDTSHILPRGVGLQVAAIDPAADYATPGGHSSTLVVQAHDSTRSENYQPPVAGRRVFRDRQAEAAARAAAREKDRHERTDQ